MKILGIELFKKNKQRELLINAKINKMNSNKQYCKDMLKTYRPKKYKEDFEYWKIATDKEKYKLLNDIQDEEDKAIFQSFLYKYRRYDKAKEEVRKFRKEQLMAFGIKENE